MADTIRRPMLLYIVRFWAEKDKDAWVWRATLQPMFAPGAEETRRAFASLPELVAALRQAMVEAEALSDHVSPRDRRK